MPAKNYGHLLPVKNVYGPWESVQADIIGPWTFTDSTAEIFYLKAVTMIDVTLCWSEIKEYDTKTMKNVSNIFENEWLCRYPRPHCVIFDNGIEFESNFRELLES